jgi:hypothetical protein
MPLPNLFICTCRARQECIALTDSSASFRLFVLTMHRAYGTACRLETPYSCVLVFVLL